MRLLLLPLLALTLQASPAYRVALGTSANAGVWQADTSFCAGGTAFAVGKQLLPPYSSLRFGTSFTCTFFVAPGTYSVTFSFVEPNAARAGARAFSATVNNIPAIVKLDLFAVAGNAPYDVDFPNLLVADGVIKIQFTGNIGNAVGSGITINPQLPPPPPASGDVYAPGPGIQFDKDGSTGQTLIRLDPNYQGVGFKPWISPAFNGPDASVTITGKDHGIRYLPNCAIVVEVWDASDPNVIRRITADVLAEDVISINRTTCDVRIDFKTPRSNYLVVIR